jgi:hypothetical protein
METVLILTPTPTLSCPECGTDMYGTILVSYSTDNTTAPETAELWPGGPYTEIPGLPPANGRQPDPTITGQRFTTSACDDVYTPDRHDISYHVAADGRPSHLTVTRR